jgi:hypothetical protein
MLFDEAFVGWGGEDRELAFRLNVREGYQVVFEPAALTYHPEDESSAQRVSHEHIAQLLRNRLYIKARYPTEDLGPLFDFLSRCRLHRDSDTWSIGPPNGRCVHDVLEEASEWIHRHATA